MRPKKKSPPPTTPPLDTEEVITLANGKTLTEDEATTIRSIQTMTQIMEQALDPNFGITPGQLCDIAEMFVATMHLKKVTPQFFMDHLRSASDMMQLAKRIEAEAKLLNLDVSKAVKDTLKGAIDLSMKEINALRERLLKDVELMKQIPLPGTKTIH